jgi:hypothetical protein
VNRVAERSDKKKDILGITTPWIQFSF